MVSSRFGNGAKPAKAAVTDDITPPETLGCPSEQEVFRMLRDAVVSEGDLSKVMEFFFDHISTDATLMNRGKPIVDAELEQTIGFVVSAVVGNRAPFKRAILLSLPDYGMKHGIVLCDGLLGLVLFFEDLNQGVIGISEPDLSGPTIYLRFERIILPGKPKQKPN